VSKTTTKRLKIASVGLGWWGNELAKGIACNIDQAELTSCYSPSADEMKAFQARFLAVPASSFESILSNPDIDAVVLATPHSLHAEQATAALKAGKHVFVEKPFTLTFESAQSTIAAAKAVSRILAIGHNRRLSPAAQFLKRMNDQSEFGELLHVEANYSINSAMNYQTGFWRAQRLEAAGGSLASLGLHMVDIMGWLFGPIKRVACLARRVSVPVDIDDVTVGLFEFESGLTGSLATFFASPLISQLRVSGTNVVADVRDDFSRLELTNATGETRDKTFHAVDTVALEIAHFIAACRTGSPLPIAPSEAARNIAVMEAFVASATANGDWTTVQS
jgi:predicted dehydrogenase